MSKYKTFVKIDEIGQFWIITEGRRILNKSPTEEELRQAKLVNYSETNICPRCREQNRITEKSYLYPKNAFHLVKNGKQTEEYGCNRCGKWTRDWPFGKDDSKEKFKHLNCVSCGKNLYNSIQEDPYHHFPFKEYKDSILRKDGGMETGNWLCKTCYNNNYNDTFTKPKAVHRTGLFKDDHIIKGDQFEELTCRILGVEKLNTKFNNFKLPLDHTPVPKGTQSIMVGNKLVNLSEKLVQTKGRRFNESLGKNGGWDFKTGNDISKEYNFQICYCASKDMSYIDRIYIFMSEELINNPGGVSIIKTPMNTLGTSPIIPWYETYRITDIKLLELVNKYWNEITNN